MLAFHIVIIIKDAREQGRRRRRDAAANVAVSTSSSATREENIQESVGSQNAKDARKARGISKPSEGNANL